MDTYSLEDDDFGDLFITQSSTTGSDVVDNKNEEENQLFWGLNPMDMQSPCTSYVSNNVTENDYSDISDWEINDIDMEISSSQKR